MLPPDTHLPPDSSTPGAPLDFAELLHRHRKIVFKVAASYAWHGEDRAELAQEIATQLWSAFSGYDRSRSFSTWMYRIALNVAISFVRAEGQRQRHLQACEGDALPDVADDAAGPEAGQSLALLERVLTSLDPLSRALLMLHLE